MKKDERSSLTNTKLCNFLLLISMQCNTQAHALPGVSHHRIPRPSRVFSRGANPRALSNTDPDVASPRLTRQIDASRGAFALDVPRRAPRRVSPFSVTSPTQRLRGFPPKTAVTRRDARALEVTPDADPSRPVRSSRIRPPLSQHGGASPPRRRSTRRSPSTRLEHP